MIRPTQDIVDEYYSHPQLQFASQWRAEWWNASEITGSVTFHIFTPPHWTFQQVEWEAHSTAVRRYPMRTPFTIKLLYEAKETRTKLSEEEQLCLDNFIAEEEPRIAHWTQKMREAFEKVNAAKS